MIIRLSHPWQYHHPRDVLDTETGVLTEREAAALVRSGYAQPIDKVAEKLPGGYYLVDLRAGPRKVRGWDRAIAALIEDSRP